MSKIPALTISASKIKTFQSCSWKFHCNYNLRLPDRSNNGALMGSFCHLVFEFLLKPRHRKTFDVIMSEPSSISNSKAVMRWCKKYIKETGLPEDSYEQLDRMILVGLKNDFFWSKAVEQREPEFSFDIYSEFPRYRIKGFIDRSGVYDGGFSRIFDWKSSKQKFAGKDLETNVQAMIYSLASKKLWPNLTPIVQFSFLQHEADPIQTLKFSDAQLSGFEIYLADVYTQIEHFTPKHAIANIAAKQGLPKDGTFSGALQCGWAGRGFVSSPDQLKKNGLPMFYCPYRFPLEYWAKINRETDEIVKTSKVETDLYADEDHFVIKKMYHGCAHFYPEKYEFPS